MHLITQERTAPHPLPLQRGEQGRAARLYGTDTSFATKVSTGAGEFLLSSWSSCALWKSEFS